MSETVQAANGNLIPKENVEQMRHIYIEILSVIRTSGIKNINIILDALLNSILYYSFNCDKRIKLDKIIEATNLLYAWWEKHMDKNDVCNKCGGSGTVKGMACICDKCGNIIWGI